MFADPYHLKPASFFQQRPKPPKPSKSLNEQGKKGPGIAKGPSSISHFGAPRARGGSFRGGSFRGGFSRGGSFRGSPTRGGSFRGRGQ